MPNSSFTTEEAGSNNPGHAGAGGSGQSSPTEDLGATPINLDGPPEANRHRLPDERAARRNALAATSSSEVIRVSCCDMHALDVRFLSTNILDVNFHRFDAICTALNFVWPLAFMRPQSNIDFNGRAIFQKKGAD